MHRTGHGVSGSLVGRIAAAVMAVASVAVPVRETMAVDYYWTATGTSLGGSGTWNTTSSNWFVGSSSGTLGSFVSSTTSQAYLQGTSGTLTASGIPQFCRINVTSGSFTLSGVVAWANNGTLSPARAIVVSPSTSLTITSTNGAGLGLGIQGGGTVNFTSANKPYPGAITVSTAGTRLIFSGVNGLDGTANSDNSTALTLGAGTTLQLDKTNNYRTTMTLNGATIDARSGGSSGASLVFQNNSAVTVGGTAKSTILSTTGSGQINLNSTRTFTVNGTGDASGVDLEISAQVIGGNGFTKSGTGTLLLSGSNTFSGTTTVTAGRLVLGNQYALAGTTFNTQSGTSPTGTLTFGALSEVNIGGLTGSNAVVLTSTSGAGVALNVGTSGTTSLTVPLSGVGSLRKVGTGLVSLTAANTFQGPTTVSAGTLLFTTPATLVGGTVAAWTPARLVTGSGATAAFVVGGTSGFDAAAISAVIAAVDRSVNGNGLLAGARIGFDTSAAGSFTLADSVLDTTGVGGGAVGLVKLGSGTLSLSGSNGYSGGTVVAGGVIRFTTPASLPTAGSVDVRAGAALVADGAYASVGGWLASGRVATASAGSILATANDSSNLSLASYPGLSIGALGAATLSGTVTSGSAGYRLGGGDGILTVSSGLVGGLPLTVVGSGSVVLAATNTLGAVALNGGVLQAAAAGALGGSGTISFGGGTLQYSAANTTDYSPRFSSAANQAVRIDTNGQAVTFASPLASAGGTLTKLGAGTLTLAAAGSFTGDTRVVEGTLALRDREALQNSVVNLAAGDTGGLGFTATGTGAYVLGGLKGSRDLNAGTNDLSVGRSGSSTAYAGQLTAASITKVGSGTLALSNLTTVGAVAVSQGTVTLDFGTSAVNDDIVVPTAALRLGGGGVRAAGGASKSNTQTFATTSVLPGVSTIVAASGSAGSMTLNLGGLTRTGPSVATLTVPSSGQVTTTTANTNGIVGPWLTVGGTTWAVSGGDGTNPGGLTGLDALSYGLLNIFGGSDTNNTETSTSETMLAPLTTNSLRIAANAAGQTLDLGSSKLTLSSGGLLSIASATAAAVTISGFTDVVGLTAGDGTKAAELLVNQANSGGLTIAAGIGDNGSAAVSLTKAGSAKLTLSASNSFTGPITVLGGRLAVTTSAAVPSTSSLTIYEGTGNQFTLDAAGVSVATPITIRGGGAVGVGAVQAAISSGTATVTGPITISGSVQAGGHFSASSGGTLEIAGPIAHTAALPADRFVTVRDGIVVLSGSGSSYDELRLTAGTVRLGRANVIPIGATMRIGDTGNGNTTAILDLNGFDQQLAGVTNNLTGATSYSRITSTSGSAMLTLAIPSGSSNAYSGSLTGGLWVTKRSAGTLRLTGTSDLAGDLTVASGTLELAVAQSQFGTVAGTSGVVRATAGGTIVVAADNALHGYADGTRPYVIEAGGVLTTADNVTTHATNVTLAGGTLASGAASATYGSYVFSGSGNALSVAGGATTSRITAQDVRFGTDGFAVDVADGTASDDLVVSGWIGGTNGFRKTGAGRMVLAAANSLSGSTTVRGGVLQLANGSALGSSSIVPLAGGTLALAAGLQTTVGGLKPNAGGMTDVGSGLMTVSAGLSTVDMLTALVAGRGDGSWSGTSGITSSQAATDIAQSIPRTVGWLDNGDGSVTFAFAAAGDTNLDWNVDILDAANFLAGGKFDSGQPASWIEGDFGYDGLVDILDAADFLSTGLFDAGPYNAPPGLGEEVAAVPEPSAQLMVGTLVTTAAGLVISRRRNRRAD
ncbi:MAG: autotransporter-associated beta strand repeat-containing protein [Planctomycetes bacterium]|nr:autotransporter-associated beta strand repeat-containing protein [Planctomycetota bacterium]